MKRLLRSIRRAVTKPEPPSPVPVVVAPQPVLSPALRILIGLAATVIVLVGLYLGRDLVGPLALAAVIVIICHPVRRPLERAGLPRWLATTAVILVAYAVLAVLTLLLYYAAREFVGLVIDSSSDLQQTATSIVDWLEDLGVHGQASDALASFLQPSSILQYVTTASNAALSVLTTFFFVLAYVIFMAIDAAVYADAPGRFGRTVEATMRRFSEYASSVRRYYVVNAAFGALVAVVDGLALWALDVPAPLVWAILSFVTNFIPNVGFVVGLVPPALLALVVGGWQLMLVVIVVYAVANVTLQVLVQPKFVSDAVGLSLTLSFLSVIFWTFVIGGLGAILAIPLTLLVRALILEGDPDTWWLRWLSGDRHAAPPA